MSHTGGPAEGLGGSVPSSAAITQQSLAQSEPWWPVGVV